MSEPLPPMERLRDRWQRTPFSGGVQGILAVAVATFAVGLVCALVALAVALTY